MAGDGAAWPTAHRRSADRRRRRADQSGFRVTVPLNRLSAGAERDQPGRALGAARHVADRGAGHRAAAGSDSDGRAAHSPLRVPAPGRGARQPSAWKCSRRRRRPTCRAALPCRSSPQARIGSTCFSIPAETAAVDWPARFEHRRGSRRQRHLPGQRERGRRPAERLRARALRERAEAVVTLPLTVD